MNLTYRELAKIINAMPDEWRDGNVTVYNADIDECWPVESVIESRGDVATALDIGHPVLKMAL